MLNFDRSLGFKHLFAASIFAVSIGTANAQIATTGNATNVDNAAAGGNTTIDSFVGVGTNGAGTLTIEGGSDLNIGIADLSSGMNIGGTSGGTAGTGTVTVTGTGSAINNTSVDNFLNVGRRNAASTGTLNILLGGTYNGRNITVGRDGATGTIIVDGANSLMSLSGVGSTGFAAGGNLGRNDVESGGNGTLTVRNGGEVSVNGAGGTASSGGFTLGRNANTTGTINVQSGGDLNITGSENTGGGGLSIGNFGTGTVNINDATLSITGTTNPGFSIAREAGSSGALNITNGGSLTLTATQETPSFGFAVGGSGGTTTGGNATVLIDGATSSLNVVGSDAGFSLGRNEGATGTMTVSNGGTLNADVFVVGRNAGSTGTLNVSGGGIINLTGDIEGDSNAGFAVGASGTGTATISGGGQIIIDQDTASRAGFNVGGATTVGSGGTGTLTVTGANSKISVTGADTSFKVGQDQSGVAPGTGTLTVSNGGVVELDAGGTAGIGTVSGSTGTVTVTGANSRIDAGAFLGVGRDLADLDGGTGTLVITQGGTVEADLISIGSGGILSGNGGTIIGDVIVADGGIFAPGSSPGTFVITGAVNAEAGAVIQIEIGNSPGESDFIQIDGSLTFENGVIIELVFADDFVPLAAVDIADFFTPNVDLSVADFDIDFFSDAPTLNEPTFDLATLLDTSNLSAGIDVSDEVADPDEISNTNIINQVPEPGTLALLLVGLVGLGFMKRRKSA